ncbi:RAMP superfamily CRISPR-associated protein [Leptotrichia sp. HSP-342]|uniref:CRISPR system Cms protein Csm4 n=1 Tax=Leptotrichia mesophila TaxID=3239303 RepID=A0AB39VEI6_9FUSO
MIFDGEYFDIIESEDDRFINESLYKESDKYLLLSSYLPQKDEIKKIKNKENGYQLIKRSGFVNSPKYSENPQKRKQLYMISSGAVLNFKPTGRLADLKLHGNHSIYRMGKIVRYKMEMEVLTPVYIAGTDYKSKLNKKEYIYAKDRKILILIDSNKFIKFLTEKGYFEKYLSYIETQANVKENKQYDLSKFLKENGIYRNINEFKKKEYKQSLNTKNGITLVNRNVNGTSYIKGSSIKGALVNLLLVSYIIRNRNEFKDEISYIYSIIKKINNETKKKDMDEIKSKISNVVKNIEDKIFHKKEKIIIRNEKNVLTKRILKENDEKTKKFEISISDTYNTKNENFCFFKDYDEKLEENNQVKPMPVIREYINPKTRFIFDITLDFELLSETRLKINYFNEMI